MPLPFLKMHGLGNDFVVIDARANAFEPEPESCRRIADRHTGVGCDQLIVLNHPKNPKADVFMTICNADGSIVKTCGNATRCIGKLMVAEKGRDRVVIETQAGLLGVHQESKDLISVDFGPPWLDWKDIPLAREMDTLAVPLNVDGFVNPCCVSMGNPHAVFFVESADAVPLGDVGPKLETHPLFPERANIEFAQIVDRSHIRMRVWERGTGITRACGSGACATLVAAVRRGLSDRRAVIQMDGGELTIEWRENDKHVLMSGTATLAFRGEW